MGAEDASAKRDLSHAEATVITNILGPIRLTDALVDHLTAQADSAIVNVTSGHAFVPFPKAPTYSATKAAMHTSSVALRSEKRREGKGQVSTRRSRWAPYRYKNNTRRKREDKRGYIC